MAFCASAAAAALVTAGAIHEIRSPSRGLPYHDSFANGDSSQWVAYDGNWNVHSGVIVNESNERGAKLVTGSPYWTNYVLDADLSLNSTGDAGVIARVSDAEPGVDAYRGLYGGLRVRDEVLVLGMADHGWDEVAVKPMPYPIVPSVWYHIRMKVIGCDVKLSAQRAGQADHVEIDTEIPGCPARGKIGLRSYDSGGQWKNISVTFLKE